MVDSFEVLQNLLSCFVLVAMLTEFLAVKDLGHVDLGHHRIAEDLLETDAVLADR